jgi:hypothetical protein
MVAGMQRVVNPSSNEHIMLLYDNDNDRNEIAIDYINEGLRRGQLAVYASVNASDTSYMSKISSKIRDYKNNMNLGNLLVMKLETFYERALIGDLEPFKDFKALIEEVLKERIIAGKNGEAVVVADCADNLSRNEKFDECVYVERWWQNTHLEWHKSNLQITVVCPHPSSVLNKSSIAHYRQRISHQHSFTIATLTK